MTKLKVTGLKKSFGANEVLKGIDIEVKEGEVVCVIGPSGSGKSTFLRCMNNLEEITAGEVVVDDFNITDKKWTSIKFAKISAWFSNILIFSRICLF